MYRVPGVVNVVAAPVGVLTRDRRELLRSQGVNVHSRAA